MEGIVTFLHVLGFFAFVIVLWCVLLAQRLRMRTLKFNEAADRAHCM